MKQANIKKMKLISRAKSLTKLAFLVFFTFHLSLFTFAQGVGINESNAVCAPSAMLDVTSSSKGLLIPRVSLISTTDVTTIANPAISLLVYNTNVAMTGGAVGFWYFNGSNWVQAIGPIGPAGAAGTNGLNGAQGPTGPQGSQGPQGATGAAGINGTNGAQGATGATGVTGPLVPGTTDQTVRYNGTSWVANSTIKNTGTNVGINTTGTPDNAAVLDVSSTTKGQLLPRMSTAQRNAIASPPNSLLIFNTTTNCFEAYDAASSLWVAFGCLGFSPNSFPCGSTMVINHTTANGVAPVAKDAAYKTVATSIGGTGIKCWITSNLGATNQATSADDGTEDAAGWYWQFNRKQGFKHDGTTRTPNTTWINPIAENSDWAAGNDPCTIELGTGWRLPTKTEWQNADASGSWTNYYQSFNSDLKLHGAGTLSTSNGSYIDGALNQRDTYGYYWSSTQANATSGYSMLSGTLNSLIVGYLKSDGFSVRCLLD